MKNKLISYKPLICCLLLPLLWIQYIQAAVTDSQVATWSGNKTAVFLLMFDDSPGSHYQVAIPELLKRNMVGTFYVNPGKWNANELIQWSTWIPQTGMVYGDHTWSHSGAATWAIEVSEIVKCQEKIMSICYPDAKPHFISYGQPGVAPAPWFSGGADFIALLSQYNLIDRPPFYDHGAVYHWKQINQMLALADRAIDVKGMEYLVIHGVERRVSDGDPDSGYQDFWALNKDTLRGVLNGLAVRRDRGDLWITDHISWYKYQQERDNKPTFQILNSDIHSIQLTLTGTLDQGLFDLPLTALTQVPATWFSAFVTQGTKTTIAPVVDGALVYDALPNGTPITLTENTDNQAPTIPTALVSSAVTQVDFTLSWTASTDNLDVTAYDVYMNGVLQGNTTSTSFKLTLLTPGASYAMTVKAKDGTGNISAASAALNVTTVAVQPFQKYEAEDAIIYGALKATYHKGYSGTGFVNDLTYLNRYVNFPIFASVTGPHIIRCKSSTGSTTIKTLSLYVNGVKIKRDTFPVTVNLDTWADKIDTVNLVVGRNFIKYQYDTGDNGGLEIDYLSVNPVTPVLTESVSPIVLTGNQGIVVFKNANNQIVIHLDKVIEQNGLITICNAKGQKQISIPFTGNNTLINKSFNAGVYFVTIIADGNKTTKRIIIN